MIRSYRCVGETQRWLDARRRRLVTQSCSSHLASASHCAGSAQERLDDRRTAEIIAKQTAKFLRSNWEPTCSPGALADAPPATRGSSSYQHRASEGKDGSDSAEEEQSASAVAAQHWVLPIEISASHRGGRSCTSRRY